ncbi:acyl-CoA thioesterase [Neptunicella sp.]|uniref:acyl-CoA thioesterase n=1 Tax=Neptunicella sp. TaxID=2125986 RepID=UPI003F68CFE4
MSGVKREINFQFLAEPTDVNFGGKVHGGAVMKWMDQVGYACAAQWSGYYCVTVSVGGIRFFRPILVGQMVTLNAKIVHTGNSSMNIFVAVKSGDPQKNNMVDTCRCIISFVAQDASGYPVDVPTWVAETDEDKALESYAVHAKEFSKQLENELLAAIKE